MLNVALDAALGGADETEGVTHGLGDSVGEVITVVLAHSFFITHGSRSCTFYAHGH